MSFAKNPQESSGPIKIWQQLTVTKTLTLSVFTQREMYAKAQIRLCLKKYILLELLLLGWLSFCKLQEYQMKNKPGLISGIKKKNTTMNIKMHNYSFLYLSSPQQTWEQPWIMINYIQQGNFTEPRLYYLTLFLSLCSYTKTRENE